MNEREDRPVSLRRNNSRLRHAGVVMLVAWAFLATVAAGTVAIQQSHNATALHKAARAVANANAATGKADTALASVEAATEKADRALASVEAQQTRQHAQLVESCERLNITRAAANASYAADFTVFSFVVRRFTVPTRTQTRRQRRITREFQAALRRAVRAKEWTPLTDCALAVAVSGSAYVAPQPVPFVARRPPASALDTANAALAAPAGSMT